MSISINHGCHVWGFLNAVVDFNLAAQSSHAFSMIWQSHRPNPKFDVINEEVVMLMERVTEAQRCAKMVMIYYLCVSAAISL